MLMVDSLQNNNKQSISLPNIITQQSVSKNDIASTDNNSREMDSLSSFRSIDNHESISELLTLMVQISEKLKEFATIELLTNKYDELYNHIQNVTVATAKLEDRVAELEGVR